MNKREIYSCITLQKELENTINKVGFAGEVHYLDVALHSNPQKMHATLQSIIDKNTEAEEIIFCVSGCGKATCDLQATTCPIAVPRTMDCIDVLLTGSGIKRPDGAIFITKSWMNFMQNSLRSAVRPRPKPSSSSYTRALPIFILLIQELMT